MTPTIAYGDLTPEMLSELGQVYWGPPGEERYDHLNIEDAIEDAIDEAHPTVPTELVLVAMRPRELTAADIDPDGLLEHILGQLDEEYGDPDADSSEATPKMKAAAAAFAKVVAEEYEVWTCREVLRVTLDQGALEPFTVDLSGRPEVR